MPTHCTTIDLPNNGRRKVIAGFDGGRMSADGGALLLQSADRALNLTERIAECFTDHRNPHRCEHALRDLVAQRLYGLALGYEDEATMTPCGTTACSRWRWAMPT